MLVLTPFSSLLAREFMLSRLRGPETSSMYAASEQKPLSITRPISSTTLPGPSTRCWTWSGEYTRRSSPGVKSRWNSRIRCSPDPLPQQRSDIRSVFFYVDVTTARLDAISEMFASRTLSTQVGTVLPLDQVRVAHEMLAGAPHARGKIVLRVAG